MLTIAKTARLIGVDQIHVGAILGKMKGGTEEVQLIGEEIEEQFIHPNKAEHILEQKWYNIKPTMAVCSGGLFPGAVPGLVKAMGNNIIIQAGGGVHGHPDGTFYGARAMRQAVDAAMSKVDIKAYAEHYVELNKALLRWGVKK
jgi:ribulose-bisphosphate carboxylase large chain